MIIENHVIFLELSIRLAELGVKQESLFYWHNKKIACPSFQEYNFVPDNFYSAFLSSELGDMLPPYVANGNYQLRFYKFEESYACDYEDKEGGCFCFADTEAPTEADCRAKTLIYLIQQKLWTPK